jgi:hypothetical protein
MGQLRERDDRQDNRDQEEKDKYAGLIHGNGHNDGGLRAISTTAKFERSR